MNFIVILCIVVIFNVYVLINKIFIFFYLLL